MRGVNGVKFQSATSVARRVDFEYTGFLGFKKMPEFFSTTADIRIDATPVKNLDGIESLVLLERFFACYLKNELPNLKPLVGLRKLSVCYFEKTFIKDISHLASIRDQRIDIYLTEGFFSKKQLKKILEDKSEDLKIRFFIGDKRHYPVCEVFTAGYFTTQKAII